MSYQFPDYRDYGIYIGGEITEFDSVFFEQLERRIINYVNATAGTGGTAAPTNLLRPSITGTFVTGNVATGDLGLWSGSPFPTFALRWLRNGVFIAGQTTTTHTLVSADEGQNITFEVTGVNGIGNPIIVLSLPIIPTASGAPWTPPVGASTPENAVLIGPNATYTGGTHDLLTSGNTHTLDAQSTSDVSGTISLEDSTDGSTGWATLGSTVATTLSGTKQVAGLRRTTTKRYFRVKYANGATGQLEGATVYWVS